MKARGMFHAKLLIPSRLCNSLHISDPKRNFSYLYFFLYIILGIIMQVQQASHIRKCTAVDHLSGKETPCSNVGEIEGSAQGSLFCRAHAMLDATASTKLKIITAREQSMQMGGAHGAYGAMGPPKTVHGMMPPSIFGFPAVAGPAPQGARSHPLVLRCSYDSPGSHRLQGCL